MKILQPEKPLTTGEVAELFRVRHSTVARWSDRGWLPSFRTPGGHRRFKADVVEAALNGGARDGGPSDG